MRHGTLALLLTAAARASSDLLAALAPLPCLLQSQRQWICCWKSSGSTCWRRTQVGLPALVVDAAVVAALASS